MKNVRTWLNEYSQSHMNPTNKWVHWICVPVIVFTVYGFLRAVPMGALLGNGAVVGGVLALAYYAWLSWRLTLGMVMIFVPLYWLVDQSYLQLGFWHLPAMAVIFVIAWVGQFIGHKIEGAKPSFFKDLQFLMIGPLWLLSFVYSRLDIPIDARAPR